MYPSPPEITSIFLLAFVEGLSSLFSSVFAGDAALNPLDGAPTKTGHICYTLNKNIVTFYSKCSLFQHVGAYK